MTKENKTKIEQIFLSLICIVSCIFVLFYTLSDDAVFSKFKIDRVKNNITIQKIIPFSKEKKLLNLSDLKTTEIISKERIGFSKGANTCYTLKFNTNNSNFSPLSCKSNENDVLKTENNIKEFLKSKNKTFQIIDFSLYSFIWILVTIFSLFLGISNLKDFLK